MAGNALTPEAAEQERMAVELRKAGCDYDAIAAKLGVANRSVAWKVVQRALKRSIKEPAEQVRSLEVARLDDMHAGLWDRAKRGDPYSVDRVLKIQERRAAYLGLDAPQKIAPTTPDGESGAVITYRIEIDGDDDRDAGDGLPVSAPVPDE